MITDLRSMKIKNNVLQMRSATPEDNEFIYNLRLSRGEFLNNENFSKEGNINWLRSYEEQNTPYLQYYFIISNEKSNVGVVRIYNIDYKNKTFTWGSWILEEASPASYAIISSTMVYDFAFNALNMEEALLDVRNENIKVISFHQKTGATFINKDKDNHYFTFNKEDYKFFKNKYSKIVGEIYYNNETNK